MACPKPNTSGCWATCSLPWTELSRFLPGGGPVRGGVVAYGHRRVRAATGHSCHRRIRRRHHVIAKLLSGAAGATESDVGHHSALLSAQPSRLAELIAGWTFNPVRQVSDGVTPQCNAVYVASPDEVPTLEQNVFRTQPADGALRRPGIDTIDTNFESLAAERGGSAIGVVLTGTGTDGVAGALRIKQAGGIVLLPDPATPTTRLC